MTFTAQVANRALGEVLDLVDEWQRNGRTGFCMPVLRDELLVSLEALADERRRDRCNIRNGTGELDDHGEKWPCAHCTPLSANAS